MNILNMFKTVGTPETSSGVQENCYSISDVPGKKATKSFGLVHFTQKNLAGDMPRRTADIFSELLSMAETLGANAVINVKLTSGSYFSKGSKWEVTYVIAHGDAVILVEA
jgi:hypothetical protein